MRVILMVDVSNLFHALRESGRRLRYEKLLAWARQQGELIAAVAFAAYNPARGEQVAFLNALSILGYRVHARPLQRENGEVFGNMDVAMALETYALAAHRNQADLVILATGDGDFASLVETLAREGKIVYVVASQASLSAELARAAHQVFLVEHMPEMLMASAEGESPAAAGGGEEAPAPESLEALVERAIPILRELGRELPAGFQISRVGDRDPELSRRAAVFGRLPTLVALAILLGRLPGWQIAVRGNSVWYLVPARSGAEAGPSVEEVVLSGLSRIPSPQEAWPILEKLAGLPRPFPGELEALEEALIGSGVAASRHRIRQVFWALRSAGALEKGEGGIFWLPSVEGLVEALARARAEAVRERLAEERPAFRDRVLRRLGL